MKPLTAAEQHMLESLVLPVKSAAGGVWGQIRLRPEALERIVHVELRPSGLETWKPLLTLLEVGGKIAFKLEAEQRKEVAVYDGTTGTFSYVERKDQT